MKWLEANFDAQDYSLWKVSYKYPTELTQGKSVILTPDQISTDPKVAADSLHVLQLGRWFPQPSRGI